MWTPIRSTMKYTRSTKAKIPLNVDPIHRIGAMDPSVRLKKLQETPLGLLQGVEDKYLRPYPSYLIRGSPGASARHRQAAEAGVVLTWYLAEDGCPRYAEDGRRRGKQKCWWLTWWRAPAVPWRTFYRGCIIGAAGVSSPKMWAIVQSTKQQDEWVEV